MSMGFNAEYAIVVSADNANFNGAANAKLLGKYLAAGGVLRRIGYVGMSATAPGTAFTIKASYTTDGGATYTDLASFATAAQNPSAARGQPVVKSAPSRAAATIPPGAEVAIRVGVQGAASATGYVWAEVEEQPLSGGNIPTNTLGS